MADEELLNKVAAAADTNDTDPAREWVAHRRPAKDPSMVYTVRIPASRVEQLRELAEARGLAPTALLRSWVLTQLDAASRARDRDDERWERDLRATTDHLRTLLDERPPAT
jgi:hypothetical protein